MTASWKDKTEGEKQASEQLFDAMTSMDRLNRAMEQPEGTSRAGFAEVYQFATNPQAVMTESLDQALRENEMLARDLEELLNRTTVYHFPKVAAASSGQLDSREGEGFKIRIKESRADSAQLYVIIDLADYAESDPVALVIRNGDGGYFKTALPVPVNGMIQLVENSDSLLVKSLRDVRTELYLQ